MKSKMKPCGNLNRARSAKVPPLITALEALIAIGLLMAACRGGAESLVHGRATRGIAALMNKRGTPGAQV